MRFPKMPLNPLRGGPVRDELREARASIVDRLLPPDPKAPTRPTVPPPTCGTLPAQLPPVLDRLSGPRRKG